MKKIEFYKKLRGAELCLDIFDDTVNVVWGDINEAREFTYCDAPENLKLDGWCTHHEGGNYIYIKDKDSISVLTHELIHYVMNVFEIRDIKISRDAGYHEVLAYAMGHLMEQFLKQRDKGYRVRK